MSFLLSRRSLNNTLIGTRIQLLTSQKNVKIEKECSPTLKELRDQKNKHVKLYSYIFEGKTLERKQDGVNWWLNDQLLSPCNVKSSTPKKTSVFHFPTPIKCQRARRVFTKSEDEIKIEKLLEVEREHGCDIETIIGHLNTSFTLAFCYKQIKISEVSSLLFEDIKMMKSLHEEIYAKLSDIETKKGSCVDFIQYLGDMIANGEFECYIRHKMMEKTIRKFHNVDPLSFIPRTNPFKILKFYGQWTSNVCNELIQKLTKNPDGIATCIDTEKKLKELLKKLESAEEVARIKQIACVPLEKLIKLYEIKKHKGGSSSLFLVPDRHFKYGLRKPLDIMRMGNFVKSFEIPMLSREYNYKYEGKYFVFERCVIFANLLHNGELFCYENHFWTKDLTFTSSNDKESVVLSNNNHNISVDKEEFVKTLKNLKMKQNGAEKFISAEVNMTEMELHNLVKNDGFNNFRRHSFYARCGSFDYPKLKDEKMN